MLRKIGLTPNQLREQFETISHLNYDEKDFELLFGKCFSLPGSLIDPCKMLCFTWITKRSVEKDLKFKSQLFYSCGYTFFSSSKLNLCIFYFK